MNKFWLQMNKNINNQLWTPTDDDMFYDQLGAVPPTYQSKIGFVSGEPWSHNDQGIALFACFVCIRKSHACSNDNYFAKYLTLEQFKTINLGDVKVEY